MARSEDTRAKFTTEELRSYFERIKQESTDLEALVISIGDEEVARARRRANTMTTMAVSTALEELGMKHTQAQLIRSRK